MQLTFCDVRDARAHSGIEESTVTLLHGHGTFGQTDEIEAGHLTSWVWVITVNQSSATGDTLQTRLTVRVGGVTSVL